MRKFSFCRVSLLIMSLQRADMIIILLTLSFISVLTEACETPRCTIQVRDFLLRLFSWKIAFFKYQLQYRSNYSSSSSSSRRRIGVLVLEVVSTDVAQMYICVKRKKKWCMEMVQISCKPQKQSMSAVKTFKNVKIVDLHVQNIYPYFLVGIILPQQSLWKQVQQFFG